MWEAVSFISANAWHVSKSLQYQQPLWFLKILFLYVSFWFQFICFKSWFTTAKNKVLLQLGNVHSYSSGKETILVALAEWIQQLFYTAGAPILDFWKEKGEEGKKGEQCSALDAGKNQGCCHNGAESACLWQSTGRRKACSFLNVQRISLPASSLLLEGNGTKAVPVHLLWWCVLYWWQGDHYVRGQKTRMLTQWVQLWHYLWIWVFYMMVKGIWLT